MSTKLPRKGSKLVHINNCSPRNKVIKITEILSYGIHLSISETHLDDTFNDAAVGIQGYCRRDRNGYGGGVAVYISEI